MYVSEWAFSGLLGPGVRPDLYDRALDISWNTTMVACLDRPSYRHPQSPPSLTSSFYTPSRYAWTWHIHLHHMHFGHLHETPSQARHPMPENKISWRLLVRLEDKDRRSRWELFIKDRSRKNIHWFSKMFLVGEELSCMYCNHFSGPFLPGPSSTCCSWQAAPANKSTYQNTVNSEIGSPHSQIIAIHKLSLQ